MCASTTEAAAEYVMNGGLCVCVATDREIKPSPDDAGQTPHWRQRECCWCKKAQWVRTSSVYVQTPTLCLWCQNDRWKQWEKVEVSDGTPAPPPSSPISRVSSSPWNILYSFTAFTKIAGEGQDTGRGCFQGLEAAETLQPTVPSVLEFQHWHRYSRTAPPPAHAPHHKPQLTINLRIFLMLITVVTTYTGHTVDEWRRRWRLAGPHQQHSCP